VAVVGAEGMLGREVVRQARERFPGGAVHALDLPELDITDPASVGACRSLREAEAVLNCAAYTAVDRAEEEEALATRVNGHGVRVLAEDARARGAHLVHVSTDFVFGGSHRAPIPPDAEPNPISAYGRSKLAGERALREVGGRVACVRTAWLFGPGGKNFVETILHLAATRDRLAVVADQVGAPTLTVDLAAQLLDCAERGVTGFHHFTNAGACSWHQFACEIVRRAGLAVPVDPLTTEESIALFKLKARRPAYSVLDAASLVAATGREPRPWEEALQAYLDLRDDG
jgi:dTDP-4-dehydrorhamnose reductase